MELPGKMAKSSDSTSAGSILFFLGWIGVGLRERVLPYAIKYRVASESSHGLSEIVEKVHPGAYMHELKLKLK